MLSDHQLHKLLEGFNLPEGGKALVERIRTSEPSRRVQSNGTNVCAYYPSSKMGHTIQAESHTVELCFIFEQEYNEDVYEYYDQPTSLKLAYTHKNGRNIGVMHTPDFFIISEDYFGYIECKTEEQLLKLCEESPTRYVLNDDGSWSCPPGEEAAAAFGLSYKIWSDKGVNWAFQTNIGFLEDYFRPAFTSIDQSSKQLVLDIISKKKGVLISELIDTHNAPADTIYWLISRGEIYIDLHNDRLTEPERTYVFIDQVSSIAYQEILKPKTGDYLGDIENIMIQSGEIIFWDGTSWTILNIGNNNISIKSDSGNVIQLPLTVIHELIAKGEIKQSAPQYNAIEQKTLQILEQASTDDLHEANRRWEIICPILSGEQKAKEVVGVSHTSVKRYLKAYRAFKQEVGNGFLGLLPKTKYRGNRNSKLSKEVISTMNTVIEQEHEQVKAKNIQSVYGTLDNMCEKLGLTTPSLGTFINVIESRPQKEQTKKRYGSRAAYNLEQWHWRLSQTIPRHGSFPFQICHIDHTELDIELRHSRYGYSLGRPWLTIMIDAFSRLIVGFHLSFDSPSYKSCMMVIRDCVKRNQRFPNILIVDRGAEFGSTYFETLMAQFECMKKSRPSAKGRYGSVCERFFGISNTQLIHNLTGNTKATKNVRTITKSVNPKNLATWDLQSLYELLNGFFFTIYASNNHPSLNDTPEKIYEHGVKFGGSRKHRIIPFNQSFIIRTMPTTRKGTAKVNPLSGIQLNYIRYWHNSFRDPSISGFSVPVRYDPDDCGIIYAFIRNHWIKCFSDMYATFKGRSRKEIAIATVELRKANALSNKKRAITARRIAAFLAQAEELESLRIQRMRDEEKKLISDQSHIGQPDETSEHENPHNFAEQTTVDEPVFCDEDVAPMETF
jgi:transposase InsO family protein